MFKGTPWVWLKEASLTQPWTLPIENNEKPWRGWWLIGKTIRRKQLKREMRAVRSSRRIPESSRSKVGSSSSNRGPSYQLLRWGRTLTMKSLTLVAATSPPNQSRYLLQQRLWVALNYWDALEGVMAIKFKDLIVLTRPSYTKSLQICLMTVTGSISGSNPSLQDCHFHPRNVSSTTTSIIFN